MYQVCFYEGVWKAPLCIYPLKPSSLQLSTSRCSEQAAMDFQVSVVAALGVNVTWGRCIPQEIDTVMQDSEEFLMRYEKSTSLFCSIGGSVCSAEQ